jgi:hypothetical protein
MLRAFGEPAVVVVKILQNASLQTMMSSSKPRNNESALVEDGLGSC